MGKKLDLTGKRFGRLVVLNEAGRQNGHVMWRCRCDCGNEIITKGIHLISGHTTSCTCRQKEIVSAMRFEDLVGRRYGNLVVLENLGVNKYGRYEWLCKCDCGNTKIVETARLNNGATRSCGCLQRETTIKRNYKHGYAHRGQNDITFSTWCSMWKRCTDPRYKDYYGRGIIVCERWRDFAAFLEDMGPRPSLKMSIDRIDFNGNYEPGNCRWATDLEQGNNTRRNHKELYDGEMLSIAEISRRCGIGQTTIHRRLKSGLTIEQATTLKPIAGLRLSTRI